MAQKIYNGVVINNTRYIDAFKKNNLNKIDSIRCKNNKILYCKRK